MATEQKIANLRWARENDTAGVGNLDANGFPTNANLTYANAPVLQASIDMSGLSAPVVEQDIAAGTPASHVPDYMSPLSSGAHVERLTGEMTITGRMYGCGDGDLYTLPRDTIIGALMESAGLRRMPTPTIASETLAADADDVSSLTVADATAYDVGRILCAKIDGKIQYTRVIANDGLFDVSIAPSFSSLAPDGAVIRLCDTYYSPKNGELGIQTRNVSSVDYGNTLSFLIRTRGQYGLIANGCRCTSFSIAAEGDVFQFTATVQVGWAQRSTDAAFDSARVTAVNASMQPADRRGAPSVISNATVVGQTAPYSSIRSELNTSAWSVEWTPAFEAREFQDYLGFSDHDLGGWDATLTLLNVKGNTAIRDLLKNGDQRTVMVGAGPFGAGVGLCAVMPGGHLNAEALESFDSAEKRFAEVMFKPGVYEADAGSATYGDYSFAIGLPLPASLS